MANWVTPKTWNVGDVLTAADMNQYVRDNMSAVASVGSWKYVTAAASSSGSENVIDNGWLECNGVNVSRSTYATLFAYLNGLSPALPFGSGDGSTTFGIPAAAARGLVAMAGSSGHSDVRTLGNNDGTSIGNRRPKHRHTVNETAHVHGNSKAAEEGHFAAAGGANPVANQVSANTDSATTGLTVGASGSDPLDAQPYIVGGIWAIKF